MVKLCLTKICPVPKAQAFGNPLTAPNLPNLSNLFNSIVKDQITAANFCRGRSSAPRVRAGASPLVHRHPNARTHQRATAPAQSLCLPCVASHGMLDFVQPPSLLMCECFYSHPSLGGTGVHPRHLWLSKPNPPKCALHCYLPMSLSNLRGGAGVAAPRNLGVHPFVLCPKPSNQ